MISRNYFPKNQAPVQPERPSPSPVSTSQNQASSSQAFVGVVPSPTPSQILGGTSPSIAINPSLLDQQFSNVMRMPTPGLAQSKSVLFSCMNVFVIVLSLMSRICDIFRGLIVIVILRL